MKRLLSFILAISFSFLASAQCDMPAPYQGNTGANMTLMLTTPFINSLDLEDSEAYLIAISSSGLVVGSANVTGVSQTSIAIWGDDSSTTELDGAIANETISFQLIEGNNIYDVEMSTPLNYTTNGLAVQGSPGLTSPFCVYGCTSTWAENFNEEATDDDGTCYLNGCTEVDACNYTPNATIENGSCTIPGCTDDAYTEYYHQGYVAGCDDGSCTKETSDLGISASYFVSPSNTGANMTLGFNLNNTLGLEGSTIAAFSDLNNDGVISECVGLTEIQSGFFSMALWGDDSSTEEIEGLLAGDNELLFAVINANGDVMAFNTNPEFPGYTTNGLLVISEIDLNVTIYGCMDESYCNYNEVAEEDDGSCEGLPGCIDDHFVEFDSNASCQLEGACIQTWQALSNDLSENLNDSEQEMYNLTDVYMALDSTFTILNELYSTLSDNYTSLSNNYEAMETELTATIVAADEAAVIAQNELNSTVESAELAAQTAEEELNASIESANQAQIAAANLLDITITNYEAMETELTATIVAADEAAVIAQNELNSTVESAELAAQTAEEELNASIESANQAQIAAANLLDITITNFEILEGEYLSQIEDLSSPILIDITVGWNIIGFTRSVAQDAVATLDAISEQILIVKNNNAEVYWPEFGFNGIGDLIPGQGYQLKTTQDIPEYFFPDTQGERLDISATVPQWVIDLPTDMHPNDIRSLVKVVNMLGQEVNPEDSLKGTTLIYLYNDASVEKKIK